MALQYTILVLSLLLCQTFSWEALPQIPSGRRSQFLVLHDNGGYKYGYDTGDGSAAKQSADSSNQVSGHYFYKNSLGQDIDLKYTAGVQGFVPEGYEKFLPRPDAPVAPAAAPAVRQYSPPAAPQPSASAEDNEEPSGDASYNFNIDTDTYKRQEASDARGNIQGSYSYTNEAGVHNLKYTAGENAGFVAVSGSLAEANGLKVDQSIPSSSKAQTYSAPNHYNQQGSKPSVASPVDGSYSFAYSVGDSSRQEQADAVNNVQGKYSYQNEAGNHDLSYVAGAKTGFLVTGGSLAQPNGLNGQSTSSHSSSPVQAVAKSSFGSHSAQAVSSSAVNAANADGSYAFSYSVGDSSRQEQADAGNNVQGKYSYQNEAGSHDLSYVAGAKTGFLVTGGSLAQPNGLPQGAASRSASKSSYSAPSSYNHAAQSPYSAPSSYASEQSQDDQANTGDASYSFSVDTADYQRKESSDASGNVQGSYSYKNSAGTHDLSFVAGSQTGFLPTGGSLFNPKIAAPSSVAPSVPVVAKSSVSQENHDDLANTGDSSYSFSIDTDEYKRTETSDANGNVKGTFSYKNEAGAHDLSYTAGSSTGFVAAGGSLSNPNTIATKTASLPYNKQAVPSVKYQQASESESSGDASYSFSIDTNDYKRHEVSDAQGNIQGSYSYKNSVGNHDLSYVAGSSTGFRPVSGSLQTVPGLSVDQLNAGFRSSSVAKNSAVQSASYASSAASFRNANAYSDKNAVVHSYLPPSNEKKKFGYIYDTA